MIVSVVIGVLGIVSKKLEKWLKELRINVLNPLLKKACLVGTGKILRKVLYIKKKKKKNGGEAVKRKYT